MPLRPQQHLPLYCRFRVFLRTHQRHYGNPPSSDIYSYAVATRIVPAPAPLPLLGAAAAFGCSRRLRKRIQQAGASRLSA